MKSIETVPTLSIAPEIILAPEKRDVLEHIVDDAYKKWLQLSEVEHTSYLRWGVNVNHEEWRSSEGIDLPANVTLSLAHWFSQNESTEAIISKITDLLPTTFAHFDDMLEERVFQDIPAA